MWHFFSFLYIYPKCVFLKLTWVSCRRHIVGPCFWSSQPLWHDHYWSLYYLVVVHKIQLYCMALKSSTASSQGQHCGNLAMLLSLCKGFQRHPWEAWGLWYMLIPGRQWQRNGLSWKQVRARWEESPSAWAKTVSSGATGWGWSGGHHRSHALSVL